MYQRSIKKSQLIRSERGHPRKTRTNQSNVRIYNSIDAAKNGQKLAERTSTTATLMSATSSSSVASATSTMFDTKQA